MTSPRSRPRPSSGSRASVAVAAALALSAWATTAGAGGDGHALQEKRAGVAIDWEAGTLSVSAGAAADLRMPSVDLARPGALRRANAAAAAKLRAALVDLPLGDGRKLAGAEVDRAVGRARTTDIQYQSNGGAIVRVELKFGDWLETPSPPVVATLAVPSIRFGASPMAKIGGQEVRVGAAVYRLGTDKSAVGAQVDKAGRLVVAGDPQLRDKLARGLAVIYVHKLPR
jgi:hypothetical protein